MSRARRSRVSSFRGWKSSLLALTATTGLMAASPVRTVSTIELHWPHSIENTTYQVWRGARADFKTTEGELLGKIDASKSDDTAALVFRDAPAAGKLYYYRVETLSWSSVTARAERELYVRAMLEDFADGIGTNWPSPGPLAPLTARRSKGLLRNLASATSLPSADAR